jgi:hypothetical protein
VCRRKARDKAWSCSVPFLYCVHTRPHTTKWALCCVLDKKHTSNYRAHGELRVSNSASVWVCLVGIHHYKKWIWIWDSPWIRSTVNLNSVEHLLRSFTKLVNLASRFTNLVDPNLVEEKMFGNFFGESRLINPNSVNLNPCQTDPIVLSYIFLHNKWLTLLMFLERIRMLIEHKWITLLNGTSMVWSYLKNELVNDLNLKIVGLWHMKR